ncbi:hypothetical protein OH76DRAFT_271446 [Lentinus brumalis]|uniref:F-box domain-containing protein n=1 Tax=Lentinus brumalis TaxID=2498619 RepID=A0A371DGW1_9APHY|nr:hypothetical protein OH76DRAFT_271446 [Polyporus brumalis]
MARIQYGRTTIDRLPVELRTMVLKFLVPDKRSLARCSLLSKDWREICLPFLFAFVKAKSSRKFKHLFTFLSGNPVICKHVKSISFQRKIESMPYLGQGRGPNLLQFNDGSPSFNCASLAAVLPCLTALQKLVFEDINPRQGRLRRAVGTTVVPFKLQRLELQCNTTLDFLLMLPAIMTVDTVQFERMSLEDGALPPALHAHPHPVIIPNLVIARDAAGLLDPLRHIIDRRRLRSLTVAIDADDHYASMCSFIREAGHTVTSLDIDLSHLVHAATARWDAEDLSLVRGADLGEVLPTCRALESLRIVVPIKPPSEICTSFAQADCDPRSSLFRGIFTPQLPRTLRNVTVCLACDGFSMSRKPFFTDGTEPELWDLATLDTALARGILTEELQVVKVEVQLSDAGRLADIPFLREAVVQTLPELSAGGLLRVV